jgi:TolB protein
MKRMAVWIVAVAAIGSAGRSAGQVVVVKDPAQKQAVTLAGLRSSGPMGQVFATTLQNDLSRSGWFRVEPAAAGIRVEGTAAGGADDVQTALDVSWSRGRFSWNERSGGRAEVRRQAHRLSDQMVKRIAGQNGMAASRIVFVGKADGPDLYCCDADGQGLVRITSDRVACVGPTWDATGQQVYYTSFLRDAPRIYRVPAAGGARKPLADFVGLNTGGVQSPDGRLLALILSVSGNPELYVLNLSSGALTRLTRTPHAAEASPTWSPDGQSIAYVGDATGKPQVYTIRADDKQPRRLTYRGVENVAPDWGGDGRIAYCTSLPGYQVAVIDPSTGQSVVLTSGSDHEDPSWAPDNRHIVCSRRDGNRRALYVLDTLGDPPVPLLTVAGDWVSPDWSTR